LVDQKTLYVFKKSATYSFDGTLAEALIQALRLFDMRLSLQDLEINQNLFNRIMNPLLEKEESTTCEF
jgi:hypothetical protein